MAEEISLQKPNKVSVAELSGTKQSMDTVEASLEFNPLYDISNRMEGTSLKLNEERTPVSIKWQNLTYTVRVPDPRSTKKCSGAKMNKTILSNVSGSAKPGQLVAIMGPSGSGKTTLLNILSGRCVKTKGARLTGYISVNGVNKNQLGASKFSQISAFVQQDDVLFSQITVKETLMTAARLRLPKAVSYQEKEERVNNIIQELGLRKAADTRVGDAKNKGVSGGERKRTNIAVEMIQDPSLLFLDEPTSGLDSFQALNVMETLKILCSSGATVIVSVHQPRSSIYTLFDQLILLSEGRVAYSGEAGQVAVDYFSRLGLQCPSFFHPGDYFLDVISLDNRSLDQESKSEKRIAKLLDAYERHELERNDSEIDFSGTLESLNIGYSHTGVTSSICEQFAILARRNTRQITRDVFTLTVRVSMACFFALFLAALWSGMGMTIKDIQNRQGILFFITINQSFGAMIATLQVFIEEKTIVMRERQAHCYYIGIYYVAKLFTQLPIDVIIPVCSTSIVYWITGLNPDPVRFLIFLLLTVLVSLAAVGIGFMIGACAPNIDAANAMAPLFMILMILFGGFYINAESMPGWIGWLENLSTIRWCFEAFCVNEFSGGEFCDPSECRSGEQVLEDLSFDTYTDPWIPTAVLCSLLCGFHLIAFTCLKFRTVTYIRCAAPDVDKRGIAESNGHYNGHVVDVAIAQPTDDHRAPNDELALATDQPKGTQKRKNANSKTPLLKT